MLARFKLEEKGVTVGSEMLAGLTTFATMAYILFVNPVILGEAGMDRGALLVATALAAGIGSILMGLIANLPFALAPGMGMNAYFTYVVVKGMGIPWQTALAATFVDGVIFLILSVMPFRAKMIEDIPFNIKLAAAAGIGLFISLIGLKSVGMVTASPATLVTMGNLIQPAMILTFAGLFLMATLMHFEVRGAMLWGILAVTLVGLVVPAPGDNPDHRPLVSLAQLSWPNFSDLGRGLFKLDFPSAMQLGFVKIVFTFTFVSLFDTAGTFVGLATRLGWIDHDRPTFEEAPRGLLAESLAIMAGALLGVSTTTTYIESAAGIAQGGRTGLTAIFAGVFFCCSVLLAPLATLIPPQATAPVLLLVGYLMLQPLVKLKLDDLTEALPAFLTLIMIPFTFNIAKGLTWGLVSHCTLKICTGRWREITPMMGILTILCLLSLKGGE